MDNQLAASKSQQSPPEPHPDPFPYSSLPYSFKKRLINLAPKPELQVFHYLNLETYTWTSPLATFVEQLYVVKANAGRKNAKEWLSRSKEPVCFNIPFAKDLLAANKTIWVQSAVVIDEYVCPEYEAVIPLIKGIFDVVYLYGTVKFDYILQLVNENTKKVHIGGDVLFEPENVESFVKQVKEKLNGTKCKIKLEGDVPEHHELVKAFKLQFEDCVHRCVDKPGYYVQILFLNKKVV